MKTKLIIINVIFALLPLAAFAQPSPGVAPQPPAAPAPPMPPDRERDRDRDRGPKVPVTFLGVETSPVPRVLSDQLGLAKGFGLVVDYVVADGPAATAGVQPNDILKMLNDQILMEPEQLSKLIRSFPEGTSVTLSILRKGKDEKVTVKLGKKEVPQRAMERMRHKRDWKWDDKTGMLGSEFREEMAELGEDLREELEGLKDLKDFKFDSFNLDKGMIRDVVQNAHREAGRAAEAAQRAAREMRIFSEKDGAVKSTKIDLGKAQIVYSDSQGEMKIETVDGKKILTAKDPQGKLLFSGPVDNKEDLDKVPAGVRQRYEKLEQKDLPNFVPAPQNQVDQDDEDDSDDEEDSEVSYQQICSPSTQPMSRPLWGTNLMRL